MTLVTFPDERVAHVGFDSERLIVDLADGAHHRRAARLVPPPPRRHASPAVQLDQGRRRLRDPLARRRRGSQRRRTSARNAGSAGLRMGIETKPWDAADHLDSDETILGYLEAVLEDGDLELIAAALDNVARAKGLDRNSVSARTDLASVTGLLKTLGFELAVRAA
jgi:probable addiction module antidote protein